jgi:D5 N terminal like/Primase C terminal 2 (PriCT-2)
MMQELSALVHDDEARARDPTSGHSRPLAICTFENEKAPAPIKTGSVAWELVVALHTEHNIRPGKSGGMLAGYTLNGTRSNANVPFRSLIQLDIDTQGVKNKETGRVLEVTRPAPTLNEIRSGIDEFEWLAASSHWHEPPRGVIKYRIVILPDRDIQPEEWDALLEAVDEVLKGALDRGAWQWSQAFYLPSCPAENQADAFFVRNHGAPLPVDDFVRRGREIIAAREHKEVSAVLGENISPKYPPMLETSENIARVKSMLSAIDPDVNRPEWRQICWAVMALGWACAETLIREWSEAGHKFKEEDFVGVVKSFRADRGTGFGTLDFYAKRHGWSDSVDIRTERPAGLGGDVANGETFAKTWRGKLLYICELAEWLKFDPQVGWLSALPLEEDRAAKYVVDKLRDLAAEMYKAEPEGAKVKRLMAHIERSSKAPNLRAMIEMAKSEEGMTAPASDFDANPLFLGVQNGILDLAGRELLTPSPEILVSKRCNVA